MRNITIIATNTEGVEFDCGDTRVKVRFPTDDNISPTATQKKAPSRPFHPRPVVFKRTGPVDMDFIAPVVYADISGQEGIERIIRYLADISFDGLYPTEKHIVINFKGEPLQIRELYEELQNLDEDWNVTIYLDVSDG